VAAGAPIRFLVNLFAPCRHEVLTTSVPLPAVAVSAMPDLPADTPPYAGLLGAWTADLVASPQEVSLHEPFRLELTLVGRGSWACFRPPAIAHPDVEFSAPQVQTGPTADRLLVGWTAMADRVPLTPVNLAFSSFGGSSYVPHRLALPLRVRPEGPVEGQGPGPPPALLRFHPLPGRPVPAAGGRLLAGTTSALAGLAAGVGLAWAARRRERRGSPEGRRRAALDRLRESRSLGADDLPSVYRDVREWLDLPPGASVADMEAVLRPAFPALADELRALECERFAPSGKALRDTGRLRALLKHLPCLALLAGALVAASAPVATPPVLSIADQAEAAFRRHDFAPACAALQELRQRAGDSPELLMDLANASWFTGRHIEALALYERAARLDPRRAEITEALAWMRERLPLRSPGLEAGYPRPGRDRLRPDEWVLLAGLAAGLSAFAAGVLTWRRRRAGVALVPGVALTFLCLHMAVSQWTGAYHPGTTLRLTRPTMLRTAPAEAASQTGTLLPAGTLAVPREARPEWLFVQTPAIEGWVPATHCIQVW